MGSASRPWERPGTHCTGGWVGPSAGLDKCGKSPPPPPGFDRRTVQPVTSRYTDYATHRVWNFVRLRDEHILDGVRD